MNENSVIEQRLYCVALWQRDILIHSMIFYWECMSGLINKDKSEKNLKNLKMDAILEKYTHLDCPFSYNFSYSSHSSLQIWLDDKQLAITLGNQSLSLT